MTVSCSTERRDRLALVRYIEEHTASPHDFAGNCCAAFMLGAIRAQFGRAPDPGAQWTDEREARRAIAKLGGFRNRVDAMFRPIARAKAVFGDIAGVEDPQLGFHVMLVEGSQLVAPGERGLIRLPRRAMNGAWSSAPPWEGDR